MQDHYTKKTDALTSSVAGYSGITISISESINDLKWVLTAFDDHADMPFFEFESDDLDDLWARHDRLLRGFAY